MKENHLSFLVKKLMFLLPVSAFILSCSKDNTNIVSPHKYNYQRTEISAERIYLFGDNETYSAIPNYKGYLDSLRTEFILNYYHFTKDTIKSPVIESIEITNADSAKLSISFNGMINSYSIPVNTSNSGTELFDPSIYELSVKWDQNKNQVRACFSEYINLSPVVGHISASQLYCTTREPDTELKRFIDKEKFNKSDTVGLYLVELVYE
jgi:hypothetical protein